MRKKQKIDKRLDQLFKDIQPEEAPSKRKRTKVTEEAPAAPTSPPARKEKTPKTGPLSIERISKPRPVKGQITVPTSLEAAKVETPQSVGSRMALTFQAGQEEWATLQVVDEASPRAWSQDEQLLVKQVTDQLSLALENARLFQETQDRASELAKRAAQLKAVADISATVSTILSLQELLQAAVDLIRRSFNLYHCHVFMLLEDQKTLSVKACGWEDGDPRAGTHGKRIIALDQETSIVARAARTRQAVVVNDVTSAPDWLANPHLPKVQSEMAIPLVAGDKLLGVLNVHSEELNFFSDEDLLIQSTLASQLAVAIENSRLFQETESALETTQYRANIENIINDIATEFLNLDDPQIIDRVVNRNLGRLGSYVQADRCYIFLFNPNNETMSNTHEWCAEGIKPFISQLQRISVHTQPYLTGFLQKGQPFYTSRVADLPPAASAEKTEFERQGIQSIICVPITQQNRVAGFIGLDSVKSSREWDDDDVITLRLLGQIIISALERARDQEALTKSEADLRALFASMEDVVLVLDKDGRYVRIAPTNPSLLVRPPEELLGKLVTDVVEKETADYFMSAIHHTLRTGETSQLEYELPVGDQKFWFLASVSQLSEEQVFWVARDITERKKAELDIARFKIGIESSADAVFMTDINGKILYANAAFEKVYGHKPQDVIGQTPRILKSGVVPQERYEQFWATLLSKQTVTGDLVNRAKDGRLVSIAGTNSPILDDKGNILGFLAVHHDITAMKQAEEALRTSEAQLTDALRTSHLAYWAFDVERNVFIFNDQLYATLHTTAEEQGGYEIPLDTYVQRFIYPEDIPFVGSKIGESMTSTELYYETEVEARLVCADGEVRWFETRVQIVRDEQGRILQYSGTNQDINERKLAEQAVQRQNEYLAASAEIGRLITSTLDLNTIFKRTVELVNERFGFYHAGMFIIEETGFNAVLREATGEAGAEMKRNKHTLAVDSNSIVGKVTADGVPVIVNNTDIDPLHKKNPLLPETKAEAAIPLRIGNRIIGALDIQSTKAGAFTENEIGVLQTLADQVAVAIDNARSYELSQQAVMEMREIDRLKSQFLANMSHELRTPLNSIIGFSRVILKGIDGPVTELQQQDLTAIYNSGQHLLGLINDILDLSKIEAGKMELAFDEVNMADVTNSVLSTMTGLIKDKSITLRRNIQPNLPTVRADAIRVRQVMINLLSNAAKFTEEGEIVVDVAVKPGLAGRAEMMVSVTDTGPGIAPQDQPKLFQPFSQVDDSPTRKTGGTGLGLSICQHLIQMHGGRIGVDSALGKGSTFYFTLPLYRKEKDPENGGNHGRVILAIDDDPQVIGLYERYLQPQGYQVISLTDPSRAVDRVRQLKPFAVTLDIMMPGIDGWQVLSNLKSDAETRDVPVIICSIIEDHEKGFSLGASDYLVKPILEEDLVNALDRLNADGTIREVLIIDDDPNDLRLLGKMLTDDGRYRPILAHGGLKGWEILTSKSPPQAVILDLFMPQMDGFRILENIRSDEKLRDIPVIVISGVALTAEQKKQLDDFGQRLLTKGSFNEKELFTVIQRSLQRVPPQ